MDPTHYKTASGKDTTMTTKTTQTTATIGMTVCYWTTAGRETNTGELVALDGTRATIRVRHDSDEVVVRELSEITDFQDRPLL